MFAKKNTIDQLLTEENKNLIKSAIVEAEKNTSGEIRVHLENYLPSKTTPLNRAYEVFDQLGMDKTQDKNGMLIYVAYLDKQFAIIGDTGINDKVGSDFWENEKEELKTFFKSDKLIEGLIHFINLSGEKLKAYFPYQKDDKNELSDDISIGKN